MMAEVDTELYLIRHGESGMNTTPHFIGGRSNHTPLTERGIDQAKRLGTYLFREGIMPTIVISSPAVRTLQTCHYTLAEMGLADVDVIVDPRFQELSQGDWTGELRTEKYTDEVMVEVNEKGKDFKAPGAESMNDVGARMLDAVDSYQFGKDGTSPTRVFIFGHGMAIRCLASTLHDWAHLDTYKAVTDNTSQNIFVPEGGSWRLRDLNLVPHLEAEMVV